MARSTRRNQAPKSRVIRVDFTGAGQSRFTPPEDDYMVEIAKVAKSESQSGNDQLEIDFLVLDGKHKGKQFRQWFSLVEQALWKLAGVLRSAGVDIPEEAIDLDFDDLEGRKLQVTIQHREYQGELRADIADSSMIEEADEEEEEEEETAPKSTRKETKPSPKTSREKKKKKLPLLSGDEVSDMSEEELEETIEKYGIDVDLGDYKTLRKKVAAVVDALDSAGHLEED